MSQFSRDQLQQIFRQYVDKFLIKPSLRIDKDGSGMLSAEEIQRALSNGTWTPFNIMTVQAMIGMFSASGRQATQDLYSSNRSMELNFEEFVRLWAFIENWQKFFKAVDRDNSGCIDSGELQTAITQSGTIKTICMSCVMKTQIIKTSGPGFFRILKWLILQW